MVAIDHYYQKLIIEDEKNSINYYARSVGVWQQIIAITEDDYQKKMYEYFRDVDIIELENANERLEKFRAELTDCECGQREVLAV
jgi:hypothetical protein